MRYQKARGKINEVDQFNLFRLIVKDYKGISSGMVSLVKGLKEGSCHGSGMVSRLSVCMSLGFLKKAI